MQDQKTATLTAIFSEVLQNLAFMFHDDDEAEVEPGHVWLETSISYHGPQSGTFWLRCPKDFTTLLAANLLGTDPESVDDGPKAHDAVKEFMNILCGQYITAQHGTEEVYDLSLPEIRELSETPDFADIGNRQAAAFSVQGHRLQLLYRPAG